MTIPPGALENTPPPPPKMLLGLYTGVAGRIYHSSPNSTHAFNKTGHPPCTTPPGGRLRRCCPRAAAGGTAQRAGAGCGGAGSPKPPRLSLRLPARVPPSSLSNAESKEGEERGSGLTVRWQTCLRLVLFVTKNQSAERSGISPKPAASRTGRGRFDAPGSPGGGHGLILLRRRSLHPHPPPPRA